MKHKSLLLRLTGAALVFALIGGACGGSDTSDTAGDATETSSSEESEAPETEETEGAAEGSGATVDEPAAQLNQVLTSMLDSHVYLAGIAIEQALVNSPDSPQYKAAGATLDQNSQDLADAVGGIYGDAAGKQFLDLWRKHIGFFVDYTLAAAGGDEAGKKSALKDLDGYRADFGALIESATEGELPKDAVADALDPHVQELAKTIDLMVAGDGKVFSQLQVAAHHNSVLGDALSSGIAAQQGLEGDAVSGASKLQQLLTAQLDDHVYLATIAIEQAVVNGADSDQYAASGAALDENSVALSESIASVYGKPAGKQFLELWRKHIGFFVDYTLAGAGGDKAGQKAAVKDLDGYRADFGALLESATEGGLPKDAVAEALIPHVNGLATAVDQLLAGDGKVFDSIYKTAHHNTVLATAIAGAIVTQFPEKF